MQKTDERKIAIVGVGLVGATTAFTLAVSGLASELVLVDVNSAKAEGEAMDLAHAAAFIKPINIYAGTYEDCKDAAIIIYTAGAGQKPGETRIDLLQKNYGILKESLPKLLGAEGSILLIVSNPVDILTYAALKISGLAPERVFGSGTVLDSSRFRHSLSRHCRIAPRNIHAYVVGEHGDSEVLLWSLAYTAGTDIDQYCKLAGIPAVNHQEVDKQVRNAGYEIISRKGATYYAISLAVKRICESIIRDENTILSVSGLIDGIYGIRDCCLSLPSVISSQGRGRPLELPLAPGEEEALVKSSQVLKSAMREIGL
ncbi:L-lactate dehydrogenase [Pelotomaculum propionicicum]|uniref:L-lactate dehydrogenase n=1 Tax=Pelotomaculum propionicicum TaxID=258475 RepID=A0A4Y7RTA3_9FIRM|nr:L-lactate dehydrogenase [Pelotomaculum propionicicum]TEB11487.1 L-lactate dehydrogenase [Pelotomaculum propionicicum]